MIEVVISKIKIDERQDGQMIFLKEKEGERVMPLMIGISEVSAIKIKLSGVVMPRPLTHDLLSAMLKAFRAQCTRVVIDKLEDNTFFAKIYLKKETNEEFSIDARPSDSIALALREGAPIFIEDEVLDEAGVYLNGGV
jgi:bifunctional DNase/RNase